MNPAVPTFRDWTMTVLDRREREGLRGVHHERNRFDTHLWNAAFARMPIDQITKRDMRGWVRDMQEKNAKVPGAPRRLSTDTIKRSFSLVSAIFTAAVDDEIIESNPCNEVKIKRRADESATREKWAFLSIDEQKAIASCTAIPLADRLAIRFAIATGLRQGEQFNLELRDLHTGHDNPRVFVRFGSPGKPPKSGKVRTVPLMADGLIAAREWLYLLPDHAPSNPHSLVFPYQTGGRRGVGKPLGGSGSRLREHLKHVGIERRVRWHDLRHTFCSNLVSGVLGRRWTLEEIRPLAGHSSITISERYSHISDVELEKAAGETSFAHGSLPIVNAIPAAPDTDQDVSAWLDSEVA